MNPIELWDEVVALHQTFIDDTVGYGVQVHAQQVIRVQCVALLTSLTIQSTVSYIYFM